MGIARPIARSGNVCAGSYAFLHHSSRRRPNADVVPVEELIGYLELGGPKRGRDYSDARLEGELRVSLRHLRETFQSEPF